MGSVWEEGPEKVDERRRKFRKARRTVKGRKKKKSTQKEKAGSEVGTKVENVGRKTARK